MAGVVSNSDDYPIGPNGAITLTVVIGDKQDGATDVTKGGVLIGSEAINDLPIGEAKDLKNKSIMCTTTVKRINSATSHTSVTYQLRGGVQDRDYVYDTTVDQVGDRAIFKASFVFA